MIYVGIDVAKNKHDCVIIDSYGEVHEDVFTICNDWSGFQKLLQCLKLFPVEDIKIGLEATGHYSYNITKFLHDSGYNLVIFNPLKTNLYRKSQSLRKTKTDRIDAVTIVRMLAVDDSESYSPSSYHIHELKSLTRHRHRLVKQRATLKISLTRLLDIIFPELARSLSSIHQKSIYALLLEFSTPLAIKNAHLTRLTNILRTFRRTGAKEKAKEIRNLACKSVGSYSYASVFELRQVILQIQFIASLIVELEREIKALLIEIESPITSIPGISYILGATILAEIGEINQFSSPAQLLAFAGLEPSTHQSGAYAATSARMVKRGSPYLRYALINAAKLIAMRDPVFKNYLEKKFSEGKHYNVALSHVAKKLVRVIFHLLKHNKIFVPQSV